MNGIAGGFFKDFLEEGVLCLLYNYNPFKNIIKRCIVKKSCWGAFPG